MEHLVKRIEKLIAEGKELEIKAPDLFGTKKSSIKESEYNSWKLKSIAAIKDAGKYGESSINELQSDENIQFSYDHNIEKVLGHLKAVLETLQYSDSSAFEEGTKEMSKNVFLIHGHDEEAKQTVARFIEHLKLKPIILHEKPNKGRTLIEKVLDHAATVDFAIALLTPDDEGYSVKNPNEKKERARQNVIFELGLFIGTLGRQRVVALYKDVELPSDLGGIIYIPFDDTGAWKLELSKELKEVFDFLDLNKLIMK